MAGSAGSSSFAPVNGGVIRYGQAAYSSAPGSLHGRGERSIGPFAGAYQEDGYRREGFELWV
jgi:hypothetical protein